MQGQFLAITLDFLLRIPRMFSKAELIRRSRSGAVAPGKEDEPLLAVVGSEAVADARCAEDSAPAAESGDSVEDDLAVEFVGDLVPGDLFLDDYLAAADLAAHDLESCLARGTVIPVWRLSPVSFRMVIRLWTALLGAIVWLRGGWAISARRCLRRTIVGRRLIWLPRGAVLWSRSRSITVRLTGCAVSWRVIRRSCFFRWYDCAVVKSCRLSSSGDRGLALFTEARN